MNQTVTADPDLPPEVAELWGRLHADAQKRYDDLAPATPRWVIGAALTAAALFMLVCGWGVNRVYFQPREATRQAQATEQAVALATAAQQTLDAGLSAQARTATAQASAIAATAQALDAQAQATATAQAATATAQAQALNAQARATATAQAATATAQAEALRCQDTRLYQLAVSEPVLRPSPGSVRVIGDEFSPTVYAMWRITNTGECAWHWEQIGLRTESDLKTKMTLGSRPGQFWVRRVEGEERSPVSSGQTIEVLVYFSAAAAGQVEGKWVLAVNDLQPLVEQPYLQLGVKGWIISVTPSPSPSPTPTETPTSDLRCRTVCDTCTRTVTDPATGETKTETYACNCREVCN